MLKVNVAQKTTENSTHHIDWNFLGFASPILSLSQKCRRLCHPTIKLKLAAIASVDVAVKPSSQYDAGASVTYGA